MSNESGAKMPGDLECGQFLQRLIVDAGGLARKYFRTELRTRAKRNPADIVTEADEAVSDFICEKIQRAYPAHCVHSEEAVDDINPGGKVQWMIDPIDGTRMFALGIPVWCVMIAVLEEDELKYAAIYHPVLEELFYAERGKGAFLNGERLKTNETNSFDHCLGVVGFDRSFGVHAEQYVTFVHRFLSETDGWLHNFGSMYSACLLAAGKADFVTVNCGFDHDYAAPALILRETGARVTNIAGDEWKPGMRDFVAAGPKLHEQVLKLFQK